MFSAVEHDSRPHPAKNYHYGGLPAPTEAVASVAGSVRMLTHQCPLSIIRVSIKRFDRFTRPR
jgi:hypothetical protein